MLYQAAGLIDLIGMLTGMEREMMNGLVVNEGTPAKGSP